MTNKGEHMEKLVVVVGILELMFDRDMGTDYGDIEMLKEVWGFEYSVGVFKYQVLVSKVTDDILEPLKECIYFVEQLEEITGRTFYGTRDGIDKLAKYYGKTLNELST